MQISKLDPQIPVRKKVSLQATSTPRMGLQILDEEEDLKIKENMTNMTEDTIKSLVSDVDELETDRRQKPDVITPDDGTFKPSDLSNRN